LWLFHFVEVDEELGVLVFDVPAVTVLFDRDLILRFKVFAVEA